MRFVSYINGTTTSCGVLTEDGVCDLTAGDMLGCGIAGIGTLRTPVEAYRA